MRAWIVLTSLVVWLCVVAPADAHHNPWTGAEHDYEVLQDLKYGNKSRQRLDAYLPADYDTQRGAIVLIHGGGYVAGDKSGIAYLAERLLERGHAVFAINYRFAPTVDGAVDYGACQCSKDVLRAVKHVRKRAKRYGIDSRRIVTVGSSAGAGLAALPATVGRGKHTRGSRVLGAVSLSGPMYMWDDHMSASAHVDSTDSPILLIQSKHDPLVDAYHGRRMIVALRGAGIKHSRLREYRGSGHAEELLLDAWKPMVRWIDRRMAKPR